MSRKGWKSTKSFDSSRIESGEDDLLGAEVKIFAVSSMTRKTGTVKSYVEHKPMMFTCEIFSHMKIT